MKLKHYFQRYQSQIRGVEDELEELTCKTIINKLMNNLGYTYPNTKLPTAKMSLRDIQLMYASSSSVVKPIPYLLQNLTAGPDEYLKYYVLDTLTNQLYTDLLINMVTYMYSRGINFIYDFSLSNFSDGSGNPKIYVEYAKTAKGYAITSIVYYNPFNGEEELEDFESILLDSLYLLNTEQCLYYLTSKIASGVAVIPYSDNKDIEIYPSYIGSLDNLQKNSLAINYRYNQALEVSTNRMNTIIRKVSLTEGEIKAPNGNIKFNLGYLKSLFS